MTQFKHALVRRPSLKYAEYYAPKGIVVSNDLARKQHNAYVVGLQHAGIDVAILPPHETHHDCVFIEDTAIVFKDRALITHMNDVRQGEQHDVEGWLKGKFTISHVPPGARIEGGDVLHLDDVTLVGRSERTNDAGIEALRNFMEPLGHPVQAIPVTRCLHLKSAMTYLGDRHVLISSQLIDAKLPSGYVPIFTNEAHAANVLRLNDRIMCAMGFDRTRSQLQQFCENAGLGLMDLDISEFQKGDGALTCQSILW